MPITLCSRCGEPFRTRKMTMCRLCYDTMNYNIKETAKEERAKRKYGEKYSKEQKKPKYPTE